MGSSMILIRLLSIIALFGVSIVLGILPSKLNVFANNPKLLAFINSFSAGLFLGLGMMHLLPESLFDYEQYVTLESPQKILPLPFGLCILSFSVILFIERVVFQAHNFIHLHAETHDHEHDHSSHKDHLSSDIDDFHEALIVAQNAKECNQELEEETFKKLISTKEKVARTTIDMEFHRKEGRPEAASKTTSVKSEDHQHEAHHAPPSSPYAILLALSIHGIFEGIAVGIQKSETQTINLVIAVLLHKWAEALTLGVALFKGKLAWKTILIQILLFSLAAPIGIAIGWMISSSSLLISAIFKAIAAGTFLYVAATELVVEEFSISTNMYSKFGIYLFALAGASLLAWFE